MAFRAWNQRQYDYPSDLPDAARERKARSRHVTSMSRVGHERVTSGHDTQNTEYRKQKTEADRSPGVSLDSDHYPVAAAVAHGAGTHTREGSTSDPADDSAAAAAKKNHPPETAEAESAEAEKDLHTLARRVARAAKWGGGSAGAVDGEALSAVLRCYTHTLGAEGIIAETAKAREYYGARRRTLDVRLLGNWLQRAQTRQQIELTAAAATATRDHEGQYDSTQPQRRRSDDDPAAPVHSPRISPIHAPGEYDAELERERAANAERAAERARVVRELESARLQQRVPGQMP